MSEYYAKKATELVEQINRGVMFDNITPIPLCNSLVNLDVSKINIAKDTYDTRLYLLEKDTMSAVDIIKKENKNANVCILNFSDYKVPCGLFRKGDVAQEESICHATNLYNELFHNYSWYTVHEKTMNHGMYQDESILSENITIMRKNYEDIQSETVTVDVLTCAAPNKSPIIRYKKYLCEECDAAMIKRIDYVLNMMCYKPYDAIILGAYGCGVFHNDPELVSKTFLTLLRTKYKGVFKNVVFAIPGGYNLTVFRNTFKNK